MQSNYGYWLLIMGILVMFFLASCGSDVEVTPTVTPSLKELPAPGEGDVLSWAIHFEALADSDGFKVLKLMAVNRRGVEWMPDITEDLTPSCTVHGEVEYGDGYVQFDPGEYIECDDIDLSAFIPDSNSLGDYVGYETCAAGDEEICMQTVTLLLRTTLDFDEEGTYPLFYYPQSDPDSQALNLTTTTTFSPATLIANFSVDYLDEDVIHSITEEPEWNTPISQTLKIERIPDTLGRILFRMPEGSTDPIESDTLLPVDPEVSTFEFTTRGATFFFGDWPGRVGAEMTGSLRLSDLDFDPSDSCGTCN